MNTNSLHIKASKAIDSLSLQEDHLSTIDVRNFTENVKERYKGDSFNYESKSGEHQNLIARAIKWFLSIIENTFGFTINPAIMHIIQIIVYVLIGIVVIYLLIRFLSNERARSIFTKKGQAMGSVDLEQEHIETVDLNLLLKNALRTKDFRLAIRYQYLLALQQLSVLEKIDWDYNKTNLDYLQELSSFSLKKAFKEVSYIYDYIWYGEQPINEEKYQKALISFNLLKTESHE